MEEREREEGWMFERVSVVDGCWWCWGKKTEVGAGGKGVCIAS